jgi:argonaute-like protein
MSPAPRYLLNGFRIEFSGPTLTAYVQELPDPKQVAELRERLGEQWFFWREGKQVFGIPKTPEPTGRFGTRVELASVDHLRLVAARIADLLPQKFPRYSALRRRPFSFLSQQDEIVSAIRARLPQLPEILTGFTIKPKFELDARIVEQEDGKPYIGVFVDVRTRWTIRAPIDELQAAGVDLEGLYVVRRNPTNDERRLVGRIGSVERASVRLLESFEGLASIPVEEVWLEGSRHSFGRCLKTLLGARHIAFEEERTRQEAQLFAGPAIKKLLDRMGDYLRKASPFDLGGGLTCSVTETIAAINSDGYQTVIASGPVEYCFDAARTKRDEYAWRGLEKWGPFSRDSFPKRSPLILVLFPDTVQGSVEAFVRALRDGITGLVNSRYSAGFAKIFSLANPRFELRRVSTLSKTERPCLKYRTAIEEALAGGAQPPDAAIVVVLDEHARLGDTENPYLYAKATALLGSVPTQEVRLSTLEQSPKQLQYILQNVGTALYAKMGGTPWTVNQDLTINDEIVIGMGTCELSGSRFEDRQRFVGITTVFRGDGNYLLANVSRECAYDEYPTVLRDSTLNILREIKVRNGWQAGDTVRIVFHTFKPLKKVEIADIARECVAALENEHLIEFAFLTVSLEHPFTLLDLAQAGLKSWKGGRKAVYVPERGIIAQLGRYTRLVCTTGPFLVKLEDAPLPKPLLVRLHSASTFRDLSYLSAQVLKFTSLSWRSTLPAKKPVTTYYSDLIAELLARLRHVPGWSPEVLNLRLRSSRWFL